jgi:queuine tRNA-ribosyltransferase
VLPTRLARNGTALVAGGRLSLRQSAWREDVRPLQPGCPCAACARFSRAYLRHLFAAGEILAHRLLSQHNLHHLGRLMETTRAAIAGGRLAEHRAAVLRGLGGGVDSPAASESPLSYTSPP